MILIGLALVSDIKTYKIKNFILLPFLIIGFITNYLTGGFDGLVTSLWGCLVPVLLLFILFALRMLGAGDIKLFSVIGALTGLEFTLYTIAWSFISGGIIAAAILIVRRNGRQRFKYLLNYLRSCFFTLSLQPYSNFNRMDDGSKFRFSYAIACGAVIQIILATNNMV